MAHRIEYKPRAARDLRGLPDKIRGQIAARVEALAEDPRPPGCKKLEGEDNLWRIRSGDYRVIYSVFDELLVVLVVKIGNRKDVYG